MAATPMARQGYCTFGNRSSGLGTDVVWIAKGPLYSLRHMGLRTCLRLLRPQLSPSNSHEY